MSGLSHALKYVVAGWQDCNQQLPPMAALSTDAHLQDCKARWHLYRSFYPSVIPLIHHCLLSLFAQPCRSGITGSCKSQQCTGMMPPSSVPTPPNSEGWDLQYCQSLTISTWRCSANCKPDYSGTPYVDCDESTGRWGSVNGMCKYNPPNACSGTPSTIPDYTEGWTDCSVKGGVYTCRAPCLSGYNPGPQGVPTSTCSGSTGNSWSAIKGSCITGPPQPCSLTPPYGDPSNTIGE